MKKYWFKKISDDGIVWEFRRAFPSAFRADRWAMAKYKKYMDGKINFRIIFLAGLE